MCTENICNLPLKRKDAYYVALNIDWHCTYENNGAHY